jgi:hypothetical protein
MAKTVYRVVSGSVQSKVVSNNRADALVAKGWVTENPAQPKPKRGRPKKETTDADEA